MSNRPKTRPAAPSSLERITAAIARWVRERRRAAEDARYWHDAQHDRRLVTDIAEARARSELAAPGQPRRRWTPSWSARTSRNLELRPSTF